MAYNNFSNGMVNNRRPSSAAMSTDNQSIQESYEYEFMKLMEEERQLLAAHVCTS